MAGLLLDGLHNGALLADEVGEGRGVDLANSLSFVVIYIYIYMCIYIYIYIYTHIVWLLYCLRFAFVVVSLFIHIWMDLDKILREVLEGDGRVALVDEVPDGRLGQ